MGFILETERLIAKDFTTGDSSFILQLVNTPGWLQFIGDRKVHTEEDARNYLLNGPLKSYNENGFGLALVILKSTNEPIGMCGLIKRETLEGIDIGFAFLPDFTGNGYASEIAVATVQYAKETLRLPGLLAIVMPENFKSVNLLKKIGLQFKKEIKFADDAEPLMLYAIDF